MDETQPRQPEVPSFVLSSGEETCEHCGETDNLHEHDGDLLCSKHLGIRIARS